jgi:hypothetical protein
MKKFIAVLAVLALTLVASVAMAEVTVSGSVDIRSRLQNNQDTVTAEPGQNADHYRTTEERVRVNVDAKNDNVKGRVTIESDWAVWGTATSGFETAQSNAARGLDLREAWIDFTIPGAGPAHVKVGHQFLQLGNGWFFRSGKYGSDAWLVGLPGKNTIAFVDVKFGENSASSTDDIDAYVLLDNFKIDDTKTVGVYFARLHDPRGEFVNATFNSGGVNTPGSEADMDTIGLWFNGKLGPINLQAELNMQMGKAKSPGSPDTKFKGNQIVVQANMPIDPLTVNATIAMGSGQDLNSNSNDLKQMMTALDKDPHYTFVYEYFAKTACIKGATTAGVLQYGTNTGFCNTTALNLGAGLAVSKNISLQLDYWMLKATEKVALNGFADMSDDLGSEVDLVVKWKLYDQLTWNWQFGRLMTGDAYKNAAGHNDPVDAIQGILSYKF